MFELMEVLMHPTTLETGTAAAGSGVSRHPRLVLTLLATAQLMLVLDVTVVNVALPRIGDDLGLDQGAVPWVMTAYTLVFGGLMLLGGRLADLVGPRRMILVGLGVFTAASLACALAGNATELLAGRAVQGLGAAVLSPAALALLTRTSDGPDRMRALAVWGALSGVGTALGLVLGGLLTSALGWRWIFAINVPIGILLLIAVPLLVPAVARAASRARLDVPGAALVTLGTGAVVYGLVNAGTEGWGAAGTLLALLGGLIAWTLFAFVERATQQPLLRIGLLREPPVAAGAFLMLVATALMVGGFFLGSFVLQRAYGLSALEVGLAFVPVAASVMGGSHVAGRLLVRVPAKWVASAGLALAAVGEGLVVLVDHPAGVVAGLALASFGVGAAFVTAFTSALATSGQDDAGLRSAVVNTFHELGGAFGVAALSSMAGVALTAANPRAGDFTGAFLVAAIAAAAAATVAVVLVPSVHGSGRGQGHGH
jgi:EmrB/QacA subfamily drug resistance transporter